MAEKEDKDDELVVVTDDPKNLDVDPGQSVEEQDADVKDVEKKAAKTKEKVDDDEDDDGEEDTRLGAPEETEADDEAKKKKQSEGKTRRQRRREAEQRLRTELKFLESRNDQLERQVQEVAKRQVGSDQSNLDQRISHTKTLIQKAESVMAEATTNQRGAEHVQAQKIRDDLRDQLKDYEARKTAAREESEKEDDAPERTFDPRIAAHAKSWAKRNSSWFDGKRGSVTSKLVAAIDDTVADDGYDPAGTDYWDELDRRLEENLPHLKKKAVKRRDDADDEDDEDEDEPTPRRKAAKNGKDTQQAPGGPKFRTGGPGRDLKSNEVYLSRERIQALKDADAWDDPVIRAKYLKKYAEYDKEHGTSG